MAKKKLKTEVVDKFNLTNFPTSVLVSVDQLDGLSLYEYIEEGVLFEGGVEYRSLKVSGRKVAPAVTEETSDDNIKL